MNPGLKFTVHTLGCKLNFAESSALARQLEDAGYARVSWGESADIMILNTCSVTENADKKCRAAIKSARRRNSSLFTIVIGCYAQLKPKEIASIPGVNLVLGASEKFNLLQHIGRIEGFDLQVIGGPIKEVRDFQPSYSSGDRTRTFLKVQDGCDYFCTFCTIPLARGLSRSGSIVKTLEQAKEIAKLGVKEVVLTGVNIGDFGAGTEESFLDLIMALDQIEGIDRFRISSIEPNLLSNDIIDFVASSKKFMPHFHIPLQSGSDAVLEAMKRKYNTALFRERIERIRQKMPDSCIGIDVITGFPGESEEDFQESFDLVTELKASYLHVFTYSERANTKAARMGESIPVEERRERSRRLQELSRKLKRNYYNQFIGQEADVLLEKCDDNLIEGFSSNYVRVVLPGNPEMENQLIKVRLTSLDSEDRMKAELVKENALIEN